MDIFIEIRDIETVWRERAARVRRSQARTDVSGMTRPPRDEAKREFLASRNQLGPFVEAKAEATPGHGKR